MLSMVRVVQADTISSNFVYPSQGTYWGIPSFVQMAFSFTVPVNTDYTLDSIEIPLNVTTGPHLANIKVLADNNNLPGQDVESFLVTGQMTNDNLTVMESINKPTLWAGQQYWLSITPAASDTTLELRWARDPNGQVAYTLYGGAWGLSTPSQNYYSGAFEISGTPIAAPVPEPATMLLMGTGLAGLIGAPRKKKA